jgi:type I restriction-modification system DNA methylase subunit
MTQLSITAIDNKNLFSNYYLDNQIKNNPEWKKEEHKAAFSEIKKLYDTEKDFLPNLNEKQLEQRFFGQIFKILNHTVEVNESTETQEFPDYAYFPDRNSLDDAHKRKGTNSFYNNAFAIGEVKRWGIELDRFGRDEKDRKRNPSLQIWIYLHDVTPKWGVLSNGAKWRLYCKDRRRDDYYEVDLPTLLAKDEPKNVEDFKYFYYFFRKDAFLPSQEGDPFLDRVLRGSADYAKEIGDDLKENVYKAMKKVAEGFFNWTQNGLDIQKEEARETVQKSTMLLLYRFLFLLYAEGKGLLDIGKPRYRESYSFYKLKNEVKEKQDGPMQQRYLPVGTTLWFRLKDLFRLINQGSEAFGIPKSELYVPAYNGGLFEPDKNPELEKWVIGDALLADAIDLLSRSKVNGGRLDFVDYSTLEIRHLGSIYEGLLEYKLRIADEDMVVNGGEWVNISDYNKDRKQKKVFSDFDEFDRVKKGQLYLATDKGERKATGSYYTPDYIVNYIVKNTVGPVVDEKWKEAEANKKSFVDATLSAKVLDPAMGSGHFLVGSIEFLSEKLLLAVKKDIDNGRFSDESHLTSDWARREVVAHCIYGVDLNDLAVELAKVSLWLTTISKDKPLSFLDHRLKQGNSLIGARLSDLKTYPGAKKMDKDQTMLPSFISPLFITHLIGKIAELEKIKDERLEDIKRKEKVFEEFKQLPEYRKAKALANVYTGVYFGNEVTPTQNKDSANVYYDLFWAIMGDENEWRRKTNRDWFTKANQIAQEKSFFHWELEFPELFFEGGAPKENPGWDAVVGNPPYIGFHGMEGQKSYLRIAYTSCSGKFDIYVAFIERCLPLVKPGYRLCFICPSTFMKRGFAEKFRQLFRESWRLERLIDFGSVKIFADAANYTCIPIIANKVASEDYEFEFSYHDLRNPLMKLPSALLAPDGWILADPKSLNILNKLLNKDKTITLRSIVATISEGIVTGCNDVFIVDERKIADNRLERVFIKPRLIGEHIHRFECTWINDYIIYPYRNVEGKAVAVPENELVKESPNLWRYLCDNRELLSGRGYFDASTKGWYELWNQRSFAIQADSKIVVAEIEFVNKFAHADADYFYGDTACGIILSPNSTYSEGYLLSLLNSSVLTFAMRSISVPKANGYLIFKPMFLGRLPIRRISFTTSPDRRADLVQKAKALYSEFLGAPDSRKLLEFASARLEAKPEESDVAHDLLAHLAERMIEMNKEKNAEIKSFLEFLRGEIGASIEDLSNKTAIQEYYSHEFQNLIDVLVKNKKRLKAGYDPKNPANYKHLLEWHNASVGKLKPVMGRIEATDGLIDAIVYKLYGLTEDEIKIVEESIKTTSSKGVSEES